MLVLILIFILNGNTLYDYIQYEMPNKYCSLLSLIIICNYKIQKLSNLNYLETNQNYINNKEK